MSSEEWRGAVGYPSYEVSSAGQVRRRSTGRILKPVNGTTGYHMIALSEAGVVARRKVHQLVAEAFIGPRGSLDTCHQNGVRTDNRACNLRYDTRAGNLADRARHGRPHRGEAVGSSILTEAQVAEILHRHPGAGTYGANATLAREYGVSPKAISDIMLGKCWAHIERSAS